MGERERERDKIFNPRATATECPPSPPALGQRASSEEAL